MYRDSKVRRIEPTSSLAPPSKRIRRLLGVLGWITLWISGFITGSMIHYKTPLFPVIYGAGGMIFFFFITKKHGKYGDGKYWYDKYLELQRESKRCGICGAEHNENCDAGLHS